MRRKKTGGHFLFVPSGHEQNFRTMIRSFATRTHVHRNLWSAVKSLARQGVISLTNQTPAALLEHSLASGYVRKNVPVNQIRIVQTSITRTHNDFDKILFKDLSIEILTKAIEILGNYDKVNKYHRWDYVRQIVGLKDSPSLSNRIKNKYENFEIKRPHIINKPKKGPSLIKGKKRKRKFPPIPKQNKRNCLTMACNFQYSI